MLRRGPAFRVMRVRVSGLFLIAGAELSCCDTAGFSVAAYTKTMQNTKPPALS